MARSLLLMLLLVLPVTARDFADGFERDADGNGSPDGWTAVGLPEGGGARLSLGPGKDGQGMVLEAPAAASAAAETRLTGRLDLANDYVLAAWILVEGGDGAGATLTVQLVDERGDPLGAPQSAASATPRDHWTLVALPVSLIDSRTRALAIRATLNNRSGKPAVARFDDVSWVAKAFVDGFEADLDRDQFPDRWRSLQGDEYPAFNAVETRLANGEGRAGARGVAMRAQGRGAGLETRWAVAVDPDRAYELTAWVKTQGTETATARAEVEWLDEGDVSVGASRSAAAGDTGGGWVPLTLSVEEVPARARKARLRLILAGDDQDARAWFDDVEWLGRVRVRLDTGGREGNVFREEEVRSAGGVSGTLIALGLEAGSYEVFAVVRDGRGKVVWDGRVGSAILNVRANLAVPFGFPAREPGPYEARILIQANGLPHVQARAAFGIAHEPLFGQRRGGEFGVSWNPYVRRPSGAVLAQSLAGRVCVPLWDVAQRDRPGLDPAGEPMRAILLDLRRHGLEVIGVLSTPPGAPPGRTLDEFFASRARSWEGPLGSLVFAHRDSATSWLLDAGPATAADGDLLDLLAAKVRSASEFAQLGVALGDGEPVPAGAAFVARRGTEAAPGDRREDILFLPSVSPATLARRAAAARAAGRGGLVLSGDGADLVDVGGVPTATWYALRTLNDLLTGATPVEGLLLGEHPAFRCEGRIILFLHAEQAGTVDAWLGPGLRRVDLFGRVRVVEVEPTGRARIPVGPDPEFLIVGDSGLAETLLSAAFEGGPLLSRANPQRLSFRVVNRFPTPLGGLRLLSAELPPRWRPVESSLEHPEVAPAGTAEFPLDFSVPSDATPGRYELRLRLSFALDGVRRETVLRRTVEVRPEIEVLPRIEPTAEGKGLEVTLTLRNRGARRSSFKVYVNRGAGRRTLDDVVSALEPGSERVIRFLAEKDEAGKVYLIGLRGIEDDLFVNAAVTVPE